MPRNGEHRRAELVTSLAAVRARIARACDEAGRDPRDVTVVAVTKTYPASDIATLAGLGVLDIGENKDQEARAKIVDLAAFELPEPVRWHIVGQVQTNKARSVASYAHAVHSLDRPKLAAALDAAVTAAGRREPLGVFIQVSLDGDPQRGGVPIDRFVPLADLVGSATGLALLGVMAVPPLGADPARAFAQLAELSVRLRAEHPQASAISAGMSDDLEAAVRAGATHVRVGTALLGRRSPVFG
ncbi:MAG TPA: YggS family pyridoxal phosphate-dependent enzyme [Jatrophihabitantaceae bacterium]|nr:YggS family pyridoxal phosphate-dependent enzyme [Jatrophihabitantaceae bacterium]